MSANGQIKDLGVLADETRQQLFNAGEGLKKLGQALILVALVHLVFHYMVQDIQNEMHEKSSSVIYHGGDLDGHHQKWMVEKTEEIQMLGDALQAINLLFFIVIVSLLFKIGKHLREAVTSRHVEKLIGVFNDAKNAKNTDDDSSNERHENTTETPVREMAKKSKLEDIWKEEDANKTYYYEADGRLVKEVNDENGAPTGAYTYMPDTDEWRLGTPSSYMRERVQITEERCEALIDAAR